MNITAELTSGQRRYGGASADERRDERRDRLIAAAMQVFGDLGYQQATKRLICAQAHLADRYFHEHFDSVHACYQAVHDVACRKAAAIVQEAILNQPSDLMLRARAGLHAFFEHIRSDPRLARILITDSSGAGLSAEHRVSQQYGHIVDLLRLRFRQRCGDQADRINIDFVITGSIGMVSHVAMLWMERGFQTPIDDIVDHTLYSWRGLDVWLTDLDKQSV
mgnify:CR=1 FL=1